MVELKPLSAIGLLDRALSLAREGGRAVLLPAWAGGALLACVLIGLYYVERVEGIHGLRLPFALALVMAWAGRAYLLSRAARAIVASHGTSTPEGAGSPLSVFRSAMVTSISGWIYVWFLVLGTMAGPVGVILVLPLLAVRGAIGPSWLARAGCDPRAGLRAYVLSSSDSRGVRTRGFMAESLLWVGALGLGLNLYVTLMVTVLLLRTLIGIEVSVVESFLSLRNTFVLILVGASTLVLLEPVRVGISALTFLDAQVRRDGWDLRRNVEDAIVLANDPSERRRRARLAAGRAATVVLACASLALASPGSAQPPSLEPDLTDRADRRVPVAARADAPAEWDDDRSEAPPFVMSNEDRAVQAESEAVLARPEFREFEDTRGAGLGRLVERLLDWLLRLPLDIEPFERPRVGRIPLPPTWVFLVFGGLVLLLVLTYLLVTRRRRERVEKEAGDVETALRDRTPAGLMDEAATLADAGDLRAALRALYVATLVALDRRHLIAFDPHLTNWQYLRQMPRGAAWDAFRSFTRLFDHKWYGREATTRDDYDRCREFASRIVEGVAT